MLHGDRKRVRVVTTSPSWCPRCLALTDDEPSCPRCGLPQGGDVAARLRVVVYRLSQVDASQRELAAERAALAVEQGQLLAQLDGRALPPPPRPGALGLAPGAAQPRSGEWRADVIRDVLLWVGGALLAIAALTFAAYAWRRLDDGGRAAMLVGATALAAGAALWLRRRLTATAEVFAALSLTLVLIDWLALRRAGAGEGLDLPAWWAIGTGAVAFIGFAAGRQFASARLVMVVTASASAFLTVAATTATAATTALALAVVSAGAVVVAHGLRHGLGWSVAANLLAVTASLATASGAIAVAAGIADDGEPTALLAIAMATIAAGPGIAAVGGRISASVRDALATVASIALLSGAAIGWWIVTDEPWLATAVTATSASLLVVAQVGPRTVRTGATVGSGLVVLVAVASFAEEAATALLGALAAAEDAWSRELSASAAGMLATDVAASHAAAGAVASVCLAVAVAAATATQRARGSVSDVAAVVVASALGVGGALVPLAADLSIGGALAAIGVAAIVAVVVAALAARARWSWLSTGGLVFAAVSAVPALGWGLATETGTLMLASATLLATAGASAIAPPGSFVKGATATAASVAFIGLAAAAAASVDASTADVGVVVVSAAGVVLLSATLWPRDDGPAAELAAWVAFATGLVFAANHDLHLAIGLTVLVPFLAVAGTRPNPRSYLGAAGVAALLATWTWLAVADVELVEAYTLPAAAIALAAGEVRRRTRPETHSWSAYSAAIVVGFGPTLVVAVSDDGVARPVLLATAAAALSWAGAHFRLQAPLVLGASVVAVLAIDTVGPLAAQLPRWATIALAGALLLWLGATADRRLTQLRNARERLEHLENHPAG